MDKSLLGLLSIRQLKQLQIELLMELKTNNNMDNRIRLHSELNTVTKAISNRLITAKSSRISNCGKNIGNITSISALEGINQAKLRH